MPNPLVDPGFETGDPAWSLLGSAQRRDDLGAHSGSWDAFLFGRKDAFAGNRQSIVDQQGIPVSVGEFRVLTFWYRTTSPGPTQLTVDVDPGLGALSLPAPGAAADWTLYVSDPIEVTGAVAGITFAVPVPGSNGSGAWEVDDVALYLESELDEEALMQRGRIATYDALIAMLQGINGEAGGYYYDLSDRVYRMHRLPDELGDQLTTPYVCLPVLSPASVEEQSVQVDKKTWRWFVFGYVPETSQDPVLAESGRNALKLEADIERAFKADKTLGGIVRSASAPEQESIGGDGVSEYGEVQFTFEFTEWYTRDELGPLA